MGKLDVKPSVKASLHVKESIRASKPPNAALQYHKLQSGLGGGLAKLRPLGEDSTKLEAIESRVQSAPFLCCKFHKLGCSK